MESAQSDEPVLTARRTQELIEAIARRIEGLGMSTPAILLLEAHKPLSFLGSQVLLILQPLLSLGWDADGTMDLAGLLEDQHSVEALIRRLESGRSSSNGQTSSAS